MNLTYVVKKLVDVFNGRSINYDRTNLFTPNFGLEI